jgi:hypothetical protein
MVRIRRTGTLLDVTPPAAATVAARTPESRWFWDHYNEAAGQVLEAFQAEGLSLSGRLLLTSAVAMASWTLVFYTRRGRTDWSGST